jgi:hypothetical protein
MKIIDNLNEFVEKYDNMKKINPLDLSSDQDLSIAIMNLISIDVESDSLASMPSQLAHCWIEKA